MRPLTPSRRAALTILATPIVAMIPPAAAGYLGKASSAVPRIDGAAFAALKRKVEVAQQAAAEYKRNALEPAWARYEPVRATFPLYAKLNAKQRAALDATGYGECEDAYGKLLAAVWNAQEEALLAPAPDVAAVAYKLDIVIAEETWHDGHAPDVMAQIQADLHRLAGESRA